MTIDEKLQHFYDTSVEEAREEAARTIEAHKKTLEQMLESHKAAGRDNADAALKAETENVRREVNKALSSEQITLKREMTKKLNELEDKLFAEVKVHLEHFIKTPEYEQYLCEKIQEARDFAGEDEIRIFLSPEDKDRLDVLEKKTGVSLLVSEESFLGGIKAKIPDKNILIDNSFLENFRRVQKEFKFDGGVKA